jgi:hypothetical protein
MQGGKHAAEDVQWKTIPRQQGGGWRPIFSRSHLQASQNDGRMTDAAEYMAYRLGQIDKKLDRLIAILEASVASKP